MTYKFEKELHADTQYNDFMGSTAADNADFIDAKEWLIKNRHITDEEHVIGITMNIVENHSTEIKNVTVNFFISGLNGYESVIEMLSEIKDPIDVRNIDVSMNINDFFGLFKRFELTLSPKCLTENKILNCS